MTRKSLLRKCFNINKQIHWRNWNIAWPSVERYVNSTDFCYLHLLAWLLWSRKIFEKQTSSAPSHKELHLKEISQLAYIITDCSPRFGEHFVHQILPRKDACLQPVRSWRTWSTSNKPMLPFRNSKLPMNNRHCTKNIKRYHHLWEGWCASEQCCLHCHRGIGRSRR